LSRTNALADEDREFYGVDTLKTSLGQNSLSPLQNSGKSHSWSAARQVVPGSFGRLK
jgi:hypothetical protein